jgi:peptidoglycan/LPS O-acetylase OafA/YrhL
MSEETNTSGGGIARLVGLLGWLAVIGGLALVAYGLYLMFTSEAQNLAAIQMLSSGALTTAFGLIAILNATMAKAMVDTANNTARLLAAGGASGAGAAATTAAAAATDDLPDFPAARDEKPTAPG